MTALYSQYKNDFEPFGLSQSEEGRLTFTTNEAIGENELDDMKQFLDTSKKFAGTLIRKTNQISLNPIEYIDKKIVAYKNPGHNFQTPYVTSNYSGLMFNSYC